jgi:hypothetical protein
MSSFVLCEHSEDKSLPFRFRLLMKEHPIFGGLDAIRQWQWQPHKSSTRDLHLPNISFTSLLVTWSIKLWSDFVYVYDLLPELASIVSIVLVKVEVQGLLPTPPFIKVPGIANFRDLGAILSLVHETHSVRTSYIYRCAEPSRITPKGVSKLQSLGIKYIRHLRGGRTESARPGLLLD